MIIIIDIIDIIIVTVIIFLGLSGSDYMPLLTSVQRKTTPEDIKEPDREQDLENCCYLISWWVEHPQNSHAGRASTSGQMRPCSSTQPSSAISRTVIHSKTEKNHTGASSERTNFPTAFNLSLEGVGQAHQSFDCCSQSLALPTCSPIVSLHLSTLF